MASSSPRGTTPSSTSHNGHGPSVSYPLPGVVQVAWKRFFGKPSEEPLICFLAGAFRHKNVESVVIDPPRGRAQILFSSRNGAILAALPAGGRAAQRPRGGGGQCGRPSRRENLAPPEAAAPG